ncbi:hypothetical protein PGT21_005185 [Puccinia graminis f. sp. tritici]|uniref:Uncharacterized protein n=1 Tax=Puccinia graminis f. sp. tritici TaxID=56615 RepID=A0A5B0RCP3_PUCGR|nr:hypothetical protein PGT21_005185 [Puccinia graminis f. sp. tritici]KAA1123162.1 hypothetical protein PGTUg99_017889 [Puccinia graminis f. sp. tritici]
MAISTKFSSLRSSRRSAAPSSVIHQDQPPTQTTGSQPGALEPADLIRNNSMAATENTLGTKLEKKNRLKFFRRFSTRFASKPQEPKSDPIDPTLTATSDPMPNLVPLGKTNSNDPAMAPSDFTSNPCDFPAKAPFDVVPKTSASLSCDETGSLYRPKDAHGACAAETHCGLKSPSRASRSFWKRLSLSPSLQADPEVAGLATPEMSMSPVEDGNPTNVSSDGHPSSIMSSELSSAPSSANETADTSLASADEAESVEECGLAGIGLRDRRSICLHSLPIRNALGPSPLAGPANTKPLVHPAMRYAPSSSSPLSSRLAPPSSTVENHHPSTSSHLRTGPKRLSALSHTSSPVPSSLSQNKHRMSSAYLNLVPAQTYVDSETLMRILRGPSSYPEETLPRANSQRDSIYVPCV